MKDSYTIFDDFNSIFDIAQLISDVGISVNMDYEPNGSAASLFLPSTSLENFFKYSPIIESRQWTGSLSSQGWFDEFKVQIDNGWPVSLARL